MATGLEKPASIPGMTKPAKPQEAAATENALPGAEPGIGGEAPKRKKTNWKLWLILGGGIFFVIVMSLSFFLVPGRNKKPAIRQVTPKPTMIPLPTVPNFPLGDPSIYANDPQILQLEGALKTFDRQMESVDLREQDLDPPELDMNVNFKK